MAFITVKFGDNEEELFNPNCVTQNLLDNIRRRCRCQRGAVLDLSDEEGGLKYLHESPAQYAHKFLKGREVFVLVKIERNQGDQPTTYTALLNGLEKTNPKLLARLEVLSKTCQENHTPKSGKKDSIWGTVSKLRKTRKSSATAQRSRGDSFSTQESKAGQAPSAAGKNKQKKTSKGTASDRSH